MPTDDATITLDASFFANHKAQFISGLSNLESGVHELRRAYISHFNTLLPDGHPGRLSLPFFTSFDNNTAGPLGNASGEAAAAGAAAAAAVAAAVNPNAEANSKRKRKPHDPNAPKRALTSYFLFMQHNKPMIKEAHPDWNASQVAEESERRWNNISEPEKQKYEYMYQVDLARYYKQKEAYEAGEPVPDISADEATRLYNEHLASGQPFKGRKGKKPEGVAPPTGDAIPAASESDAEEEVAPPPAKKQRQKKGAAAAVAAAEEPKSATKGSAKNNRFKEIVPAKSPEAPKKKGGRKSKAADETPVVEESAKKEKKSRKRKSAANE